MSETTTEELLALVAQSALDEQVVAAGVRDQAARSQGHFHPSTVGHCPRRTVFERLGAPTLPLEQKIYRIFSNGHSMHARVQAELQEAGLLVQAEVALSAPEYNLSGHADGIGRFYIPTKGGVSVILEIKSANLRAFDWMIGEPLKHWKPHGVPREHLWQVQLYLYMSGLPYGVFLYECKNDQRRAYYAARRDPELINGVLLPRVQLVNAHVASRTLPPRDSEHAIINGQEVFECRYCPYRLACQSAEKLEAASQPFDPCTL